MEANADGMNRTTRFWLHPIGGRADAPRRLLCFPYAGGSAAIYRKFESHLTADVQSFAVQLPGRGPRIRERPLTSMGAVMDGLMPALLPMLDRPTVLLGYSNGALLAFELARRLAAARADAFLQRLILIASPAPGEQTVGDTLSMDDARFVEFLRRLDGMPPEIASNEELLQFLLPMLRADFAIGESYRSERGHPRIDVPISAIAARADATTSIEQVARWALHTARAFELQQVDGGHFVINENLPGLLVEVGTALQRDAADALRDLLL
jgi:medium-chain acyl-[acyl-carrier-protein] hydrolase